MTTEITIKAMTDDADLANWHHYTESGLSNYWLSEHLFLSEIIDGEEYISYPQFENIHAAIGINLCELQRGLGPREIKFLRKELSLTQLALGKKFGLADDQIVSRAESLSKERHSPLSKSNDALLRIFYLKSLFLDNKDVSDYLKKAASDLFARLDADLTFDFVETQNMLVA